MCRKVSGEEIAAINIAWLKDKSPSDSDNLPYPDELAEEIVENLESALDGVRLMVEKLKKSSHDIL